MTRFPVTIGMDHALWEIRDIFSKTNFHHILVVDNHGKLYGVISDRDLLKGLSHRLGTAAETDADRATLHKKAHQVMSRNPVTVHEKESFITVVNIFEKRRFSCVPVVEPNDEPVGIITVRDIIHFLSERFTIGKRPL